MKIEKVDTADGTATLRNTLLNETYHSTHGALQESMYVFIQHGLLYTTQPQLQILEVGLGTGLNALLTAVHAGSRLIQYTSLETFPLSYNQVSELGYLKVHANAEKWLRAIHSGTAPVTLGNIQLQVLHQSLQETTLTQLPDLIFYDAFGPRAQPEMWNENAVEAITRNSKQATVLVTYCSQGQFRRNLQQAGWKVEKLPGPPGKREMVRAVKV